MAINFFRFSLNIIPHGGPEKIEYSRREVVKGNVWHWQLPDFRMSELWSKSLLDVKLVTNHPEKLICLKCSCISERKYIHSPQKSTKVHKSPHLQEVARQLHYKISGFPWWSIATISVCGNTMCWSQLSLTEVQGSEKNLEFDKVLFRNLYLP